MSNFLNHSICCPDSRRLMNKPLNPKFKHFIGITIFISIIIVSSIDFFKLDDCHNYNLLNSNLYYSF